ncbi:MAG: MFS transporter [Chloroflexota bacterium]
MRTTRLPLALMLFGVFVAASDLTVVSTILPQIIFDLEIPLRTGLAQAAWIVNAYLIAYTVTMPLMGRVSDLFGRRNIFLFCLALFSIGSVVAGLATTLDAMIVGRAVQALGAGAMVPVTMAFVADALPTDRRPFALGFVGAVDTAGWVIGPLYGAAMVLLAQWRWIFFINVPISVVIAVGLWWTMRHSGARRQTADGEQLVAVGGRRSVVGLDWLGALTLTIALVALTLAFSGAQQESGGSLFVAQSGFNPFVVPLVVIAAFSLVAFVWQERRTAQPLIPLSMFADRTFSAACVANFLVGAALIIAMVDVPVFVNIAVAPTFADAPLLSGEALALFTLGMVGGSLAGGWLTGRRGYRVPSLLGLALGAIGFALMSQWRVGIALSEMAAGLCVCGLGFGFVIAPLASAVINAVGEAQRGIASAIVLIQRLIGMALGLAALTTWGLFRLNVLSAALPPLNLNDPTQAARVLFAQARLVSAQVIGELFVVAALICLVACLPALLMRVKLSGKSSTAWFGWR